MYMQCVYTREKRKSQLWKFAGKFCMLTYFRELIFPHFHVLLEHDWSFFKENRRKIREKYTLKILETSQRISR